MQVENNTVVALRYSMKNKAGEILEDNTDTLPIEYVHGTGNLLPALENAIKGLRVKDKISFSVKDDFNRGEFFFDVMVDAIRKATREEIEKGEPAKTANNNCGPGCCC